MWIPSVGNPGAAGGIPECRRSSCSSYLSTAHNIQWILFIFGTAIDPSMSMNSIGYGVSMFIF